MSATDELRKLLDERGVEWMDDSYAQLWCTVWHGSDGKQWRMTENRSGMLTELKAWQTTPEQAIAATLGNRAITAEQVMTIAGKHQPEYCSDTHVCFDFQAIADELNATLGNWTCEYAIKDNMNESEGMGDVWIECSACHCAFDYYADDWLMNMHYCPNCGARVERRAQ